jgi:CheY-like chemotaxis protein
VSEPGIILVAEDNADDYLLIDLACRRAGIELPRFRVTDGVEARQYLQGEERFADRKQFPLPAMILADLKMPRMNGLELLGWVRTHPTLKRIPFVFLTSSAHHADINQAYDQFANSYLVKPIELGALIELLKNLKEYWLGLNKAPTPTG